MNVEEMKKTVIEFVQQQDDETKLQRFLSIVAELKEPKLSAKEAYERIKARYPETLAKLAQ